MHVSSLFSWMSHGGLADWVGCQQRVSWHLPPWDRHWMVSSKQTTFQPLTRAAYLVFSQTQCRTHYCAHYFKEILYYTSRLPQMVPVKQPAAFCQRKEKNWFAQFRLAKVVGRAECSVGGRSWWHWVIRMVIFHFLPPEVIRCFLLSVKINPIRPAVYTEHHCFLVLCLSVMQCVPFKSR